MTTELDGELMTTPPATPARLFRPHIHYTPAANWMNDPNGLVYCAGRYHLYYQYNPHAAHHQHMHWGQAISTDLLHWQEQPVALGQQAHEIFSGSAVVDWHNTSGFGEGGRPPLVACYTGHTATNQAQFLAYSLDEGASWAYHAGPVLDLGKQDFRDPKVFWHAESSCWIMVIAHPAEHQVEFFRSANLREWTALSVFGPQGAVGGIWEVPDLFPLRDAAGQEHWILKVDLFPGGPHGGSGVQYWLGDFDGRAFTPRTPARWVDHGQDFYAALTWSDLPERRVWLAWMSNWHYARHSPTGAEGWRGAMTLPRELRVCDGPDGLMLAQQPVPELQALRQEQATLPLGGTVSLRPDQAYEFRLSWASAAALSVRLNFSSGAGLEASVELTPTELIVWRPESHSASGLDGYAGTHRATLPQALVSHDLHLFLDACSLEVFAAGGRVVITDLLFAAQPIVEVEVTASGLGLDTISDTVSAHLWPLTASTASSTATGAHR
jgi:fructan beta-fructosidase